MKTTFIIFFFLVINLSFSQKCKYVKNEIDEFTKKEVLITKTLAITKIGMGLGATASVLGKRYNNTKYLEFQFSSPNIFTLNEGDAIMFKTTDNKTVKLIFEETVIANYVTVSGITIWTAQSSILLTDDIINKLKNIEVKKVRWYTSKGYIEKDAKKKYFRNLSKVINCIK